MPTGVGLAYASGNFAIGALPSVLLGLLLYFWVQKDGSKEVAFLGAISFGLVQMFGRIQDAVSDPIIGYWSDRLNTRFGRRLPWIVAGTPLLLGSFVAAWYPPAAGTSSAVNFVYLTVVLSAFWWGFTIVFAPYLSLLPELTTDLAQRIRISQWMAYFEVAGNFVGMVAAGLIIDSTNLALFETMPEVGRPAWGDFHPHGYHVMAWSVAGLCLLSLLPVVLFVRETGACATKAVPFHFLEAARTCLGNRAFRIYVLSTAAYRLGFSMVVASIPLFLKTLLHQSEGVAGTLSGITLLASLFLLHPVDVLARRHGKKRVYLWGLGAFALALPLLATIAAAPVLGQLVGPSLATLIGAQGDPQDLLGVSHAVLVFVLISPAIAVMFVLPRPIVADVMDLDFERTGYHREAMYNGMEAVFTKTAAGLSLLILAALSKLDPGSVADGAGGTTEVVLGETALTAVGPLGGLFVALAWWLMRRYPIEH